MPTQYSLSADTLCLSIRALRLSRGEAPALFGSILSPGAARWSHEGWRVTCAGENWACGAGRSDRLPPLPVLLSPGLPSVSDTPVGAVIVTYRVAHDSLWLLISKAGTWKFGSPTQVNFASVTLSSSLEGEGFEPLPVLYYSLSPNLSGSGLAVCVDTHRGPSLVPPVAILWDYVDSIVHRMQSTSVYISFF